MSTAAMNGHADVPADMLDDMLDEPDPDAPETEPETAGPAGSEGQRVGVHDGGRAGALSRARALARARGGAAAKVAAEGLRHDQHHGPPWEERPMSLSHLRLVIHQKSTVHSVIPGARLVYLAFGYGVSLPVSVVLYSVLWVVQGLPRAVIAFVATVILHRCHLLPGLPAGIAHIPVAGLIAGWLF
jgi:hypothetical protein